MVLLQVRNQRRLRDEAGRGVEPAGAWTRRPPSTTAANCPLVTGTWSSNPVDAAAAAKDDGAPGAEPCLGLGATTTAPAPWHAGARSEPRKTAFATSSSPALGRATACKPRARQPVMAPRTRSRIHALALARRPYLCVEAGVPCSGPECYGWLAFALCQASGLRNGYHLCRQPGNRKGCFDFGSHSGLASLGTKATWRTWWCARCGESSTAVAIRGQSVTTAHAAEG